MSRQPPISLEAERSLLGGIILSPPAYDEVLALITVDDFFLPAHREIWESMVALVRRGTPIDVVALADELRRRGAMPKLEGGETYLVQIAAEVPTAENIEHYARIVHEKASLRRLIALCGEISARAYGEYGEYPEFMDEVESSVFALSQARPGTTSTTAGAAMPELLTELERRSGDRREITGVPTGLSHFDRLTSGLQPTHFVVVAARPGMGKTSWALNIAAHASIHHKIPVLIFSLEMSKTELLERMLSAESRVPGEAIRRGTLTPQAWRDIYPAASKLSEAPIVIDDHPGATITEIAAKARRFRANRSLFPDPREGERPPLGLVIVDYLQLIKGAGKRDREQEVGDITRGLKGLAKTIGLPVIGVSQLNRELEKRDDKRPKLSDLRESGSIEQDADVVTFIHRDDYFDPEDPTIERGKAEMLLRKNRHGDIGRCFATWRRDITRFENYAMDYAAAPDARTGEAADDDD